MRWNLNSLIYLLLSYIDQISKLVLFQEDKRYWESTMPIDNTSLLIVLVLLKILFPCTYIKHITESSFNNELLSLTLYYQTIWTNVNINIAFVTYVVRRYETYILFVLRNSCFVTQYLLDWKAFFHILWVRYRAFYTIYFLAYIKFTNV